VPGTRARTDLRFLPVPLPTGPPPDVGGGLRCVWAADVAAGTGRWVLFQAPCAACGAVAAIIFPDQACRGCVTAMAPERDETAAARLAGRRPGFAHHHAA
jgi:hypothetical protein